MANTIRNARIQLQPDQPVLQTTNIDPKTGLPLGPEFDVVGADGKPVETDGSGNPIFNGQPYTYQERDKRADTVTFASNTNTINIDRLVETTDTTISELIAGSVNSVVNTGPFGRLCDILSDITGGDPGNGQLEDLLSLIEQLRARIVELEAQLTDQNELRLEISELEFQLGQTADELENLVDVVNALQACKTRLEASLKDKNNAVKVLGNELKESELERARLLEQEESAGGPAGTEQFNAVRNEIRTFLDELSMGPKTFKKAEPFLDILFNTSGITTIEFIQAWDDLLNELRDGTSNVSELEFFINAVNKEIAAMTDRLSSTDNLLPVKLRINDFFDAWKPTVFQRVSMLPFKIFMERHNVTLSQLVSAWNGILRIMTFEQKTELDLLIKAITNELDKLVEGNG